MAHVPIGFLFGLDFDTATEVGLLGIAAIQAAQGMSYWTILIFPALFTAGMSLIDTTDSVLMTGPYGWAFNAASTSCASSAGISSIETTPPEAL